MILYLLRHGVSESNDKNIFAAKKINLPLTPTGVQQAEAQAKVLKNVGFEKIYTSPLVRAKQTAEIVGRSCDLEPITTDCLCEIDVGILDGQSMAEPYYWRIWEQILEEWEKGKENIGFPEGEALNDIKARFTKFLNELEEIQQPTLIVSHCGFLMVVIWAFCENHGSTFEHGHMGRGCYSIISGSGRRFQLTKFNVFPTES
jgi:alpha-ribazole phosphatase